MHAWVGMDLSFMQCMHCPGNDVWKFLTGVGREGVAGRVCCPEREGVLSSKPCVCVCCALSCKCFQATFISTSLVKKQLTRSWHVKLAAADGKVRGDKGNLLQ